uniref:Glutamate decarboxylase 1 n=3 Tax=Homininae TaxID=207598 RepID=A0A2I3S319_PANTR
MASSTPSSSATSSNAGADPNTTNLRPTTYDTWCGVAHGCTRKLGLKICGNPKGTRPTSSGWSSPTQPLPSLTLTSSLRR